ncbi:hypothetical protein SFRURICE_016976 [Spodoptera frugiperda]|nr:hypothetical protein SFRURICE_016976 [Spodoptera frugiperda]
MKNMINSNPIIDNFLDKSFQNVLLPYRLLHHSVFLSRFSIKHNCIRPHERSYYIFSLIGVICWIIYTYNYAIIPTDKFNELIDIFLMLNTYMLVSPFFVYYIVNVIKRMEHVEILIRIQKCFRIIHYNKYRDTTTWNWFGIFCHSFWIIVSLVVLQDINIAISFYIINFYDIHTTYGMSMMFMLKYGMYAWISEVKYKCKISLELEERKRDQIFCKLFQAYEELMKAYVIFKSLFKYSYHISVFAIITIIWVIKNVSCVMSFSMMCEQFYISVSDAQETFFKMLKSFQNTEAPKRFCKNIIRYHEATFHKMTALNIFTVDANLAHEFASLEVEYIVILLQFALTRFKH